MWTIQHIKYLLASEYVHKTLSLVESSELKVALFAGNVQEKLKPVARLVILLTVHLGFVEFFTPWLVVSGSKIEKAQTRCKIGDFFDSSLKFDVFFFTLLLEWWLFLTVLRLDSLFLVAKKDCILLKFKRSQCRFPAQIPFLTFYFLFSTVGALVVITV